MAGRGVIRPGSGRPPGRPRCAVLGAAGLILPPLTGIAPWLAVAAAIGFALIQVGGIVAHVSRGEAGQIGLNIALLAAAAAAAWPGLAWL